MNVSEIMTTEVQVVSAMATLQQAAKLMDRLGVGALPVCDDHRRLIGMVTDRDITIRGTAAGFAPDVGCVGDVMSTGTQWCTEDQDTEEVMRVMGEAQVRRLPVINVDRELVGIVSIGDMATKQPAHIDEAVRAISTPSETEGLPVVS